MTHGLQHGLATSPTFESKGGRYHFTHRAPTAEPTEIQYDRTEGFKLSNEVLVVDDSLLRELGHFIFLYETALRHALRADGEGIHAVRDTLFQGLGHQLWQRHHRNALMLPGLVRLDMGLDPLGIYEIQPRPGGLGFQPWFQHAFGYPMVFVDRFVEMIQERSGKEKPRLLILITEKDARYLKETEFFANQLRGKGLHVRLVVQEDQTKACAGSTADVDIVYPRGRFDNENPELKRLLVAKVPFAVPPNHFFHSKSGLALLRERVGDGWDTYVPPTRVVDHQSVGDLWDWTKEDRTAWVIKPANDWGSADVDRASSLTQGGWREKLVESLSRAVKQKSPFVVQGRRESRRQFAELDNKAATWILRACYTLANNTYHFAGAEWNARVGTVRIHGAADALMGLAVSSAD